MVERNGQEGDCWEFLFMSITKDTWWYFRVLSAEFLTCASRLAVRFTGVLCHLLRAGRTNWDKRSCDEQTHGKVRDGLGCHREGYSTAESCFWVFPSLFVCVWRKVLFPKLILMARLPFDTPWEKAGKRDLLSSSDITLQSSLKGRNRTWNVCN